MQKSLNFWPHTSLRCPQHWGLHACIFSALAGWGHHLIDSSQVCIAVYRLRFGYGWTVNRLHFLVIVRALVFTNSFCGSSENMSDDFDWIIRHLETFIRHFSFSKIYENLQMIRKSVWWSWTNHQIFCRANGQCLMGRRLFVNIGFFNIAVSSF